MINSMRGKQRRSSGHRSSKRDGGYEKPQKKRKPFRPIRTFFKIVVSIVMAFLILSGGAAFAYYKVTGESPFGGYTGEGSNLNLLDAMLGRDIKLNVAVFGTDKEGETYRRYVCGAL